MNNLTSDVEALYEALFPDIIYLEVCISHINIMDDLITPLWDAIDLGDREKVKSLLDGLGKGIYKELVRYPNWMYALVDDGYLKIDDILNSNYFRYGAGKITALMNAAELGRLQTLVWLVRTFDIQTNDVQNYA